MEEILTRELNNSNPWWFGESFKTFKYRRTLYFELKKFLKYRQIMAIAGIRRAGKTVLMNQLIEELLKENNSKNILFFSFEEYHSKDTLENILYHYLKNFPKNNRKYIFFDEIQKVKYWQDVLKRFYDRDNNIKFIVCGSSSLKISQSKESLAGRIYDFYLPCLSFIEFLQLNEISLKIKGNSLKEKYDSALYYKEILEFQFGEYIFKGAFPELAKTQDAKIINKYISNSVIERIIFKDIPEVFDVKNKQALNSILLFSARETSNLFTFENLSQIIGIDRETAKKYVNYLVLSLIIDELWNYTASAAKQIRTNKKVHIIHPSISIAVQKYRREILSINEVMGRYVESIVYQHCRLFADRLFFWRTPQKEEVNIIAEVKNKLIITCLQASKSAIEKVKKAGGEIIVKEVKEIKTPLIEKFKKLGKTK